MCTIINVLEPHPLSHTQTLQMPSFKYVYTHWTVEEPYMLPGTFLSLMLPTGLEGTELEGKDWALTSLNGWNSGGSPETKPDLVVAPTSLQEEKYVRFHDFHFTYTPSIVLSLPQFAYHKVCSILCMYILCI